MMENDPTPYYMKHCPKSLFTKMWKLWQLSKKVLFSCLVLSLVSLQRLANSHSPGARNDIKYGQLWAWHSHGNQYVICHSCNCQAGTPCSPNLVLVKEEVSSDYFLILSHLATDSKMHRWTKYWKSNSFLKYRYLINTRYWRLKFKTRWKQSYL